MRGSKNVGRGLARPHEAARAATRRPLEEGVEAGEDAQAGGDHFQLELPVVGLVDFLYEGGGRVRSVISK